MTITAAIYQDLVTEVQSYGDAEAYASDLALSSLWGDAPETDIPADRFSALQKLYSLATMPLGNLIRSAGLTQQAISTRFLIPKRTVESWCSSATSARSCPIYTRMMICECLGLMPFTIS